MLAERTLKLHVTDLIYLIRKTKDSRLLIIATWAFEPKHFFQLTHFVLKRLIKLRQLEDVLKPNRDN